VSNIKTPSIPLKKKGGVWVVLEMNGTGGSFISKIGLFSYSQTFKKLELAVINK
jgi:hypothetical protein